MARTDTLGHFLTDVADSIRAKTGSSATIQASNFDTEIGNIPSGGGEVVEKKDINFYDYDGTITNSYTKTEFMLLTEMPSNPTHDKLTSMGWNWTLQEAKDYLSTHNYLEIGQVYELADCSIMLFVNIDDYTLKPYISFAVNGNATIDWGDNTTTDVTGSSISTMIDTQHTYSTSGDYVIKISSSNNIILPEGDSTNGSKFYWSGINNDEYANGYYNNNIEKIFFNSNIDLSNSYIFYKCKYIENVILPNNLIECGDHLFYLCNKIKHITTPKQANYVIPQYCFSNCYNLKSVSLSSTTQKIISSSFLYCYNLDRITLPNNLTNFGSTMFSYSQIKEIEIPNNATSYGSSTFARLELVKKITINNINSVTFSTSSFSYGGYIEFIVNGDITSIGSNTFNSSSYCLKYDFTNCTFVPTLSNKNAFTGINENCKIVVPNDLYNSWITANNWSNYTSYIVKESDYNA